MKSSKGLIVVVIGVSGVGKTTIAQALADKLHLECIDADDYHPPENISKMSQGHALNDDDRRPWLDTLNSILIRSSDKGIVLACSALKESYRQRIAKNLSDQLRWVVLHGDFNLIQKRMESRDHFMPSNLLRSQFKTWEEPEYGIKINVKNNPTEIIQTVIENLDMEQKAKIGLIGLGVMGKSLSRNIARRGIKVSVYNRHVTGSEEGVAENFVQAYDEMASSDGYDDIKQFVDSLASPKAVFLMVNAGPAVDSVIQELVPLLDEGDLIIDGGNSHYKDTERRFHDLKDKGIGYIGSGVSGGEEGALNGPSIMPGGGADAYDKVKDILTAITAVDDDGTKCCAYIGAGGAGHFVKMVHNGIEYGEMQLIAEVYGLLRHHMNYTPEQISKLFDEWGQTECGSYLLEITAVLLKKKEGERHLIDLILDKAGNKGTGGWTTVAAIELGVAIPTLTAALFARYQSAQYDQRQKASSIYSNSNSSIQIDSEQLRLAYQVARIINHHQGYDLIAAASKEYDWGINYRELSRIWTNGCIIRSKLMVQISGFDFTEPDLLLQAPLQEYVQEHKSKLQNIISESTKCGISAPCFFSSLSYLNGYTEHRSLANMIQAQRDFFGAHTYERVDAVRGEKFHTNWLEKID